MGKVTTVLFDLGNVLAYIDFHEFWRSLGFMRPEEIEPFADGYHLWTRRYEIGFISTAEYLAGLDSVFHQRFLIGHIEQAFANIILGPVDGMLELVTRVSRTRRTALVSNTNEIHYKKSLNNFEVLRALHTHYCYVPYARDETGACVL